MEIDSLDTRPMEIRLRRNFVTSVRRDGSARTALVRLATGDGLVGYGEAPQNTRLTGETLASIAAFVDMFSVLARGADITEFRAVLDELDGFPVNSSAKHGIVGALTDAAAKSRGLPLHALFGGRPRPLVNDLTVSLGGPETMLSEALDAVARGYTVLKLKLDGDEKANLHRMRLLAADLPATIRYRIDPNQSWTPKSAVRQITALCRLGDVEFVEQPVHRDDLAGLKLVRDTVEVPIVADESVFTEADARRVLESQAADLINIKLVKCGGAVAALRIADLAEQFGVPCMLGCTTETQLSLASSVAVAVSHRNIAYVDLDGACNLTGLPFDDPFAAYGPEIVVGSGAGCGVTEIDLESPHLVCHAVR